MIKIEVQQQDIYLLPSKAIYWPREKALLISDLHLGKTAHFRKASLAVPQGLHHNDLIRLSKLISSTSAERVLILGDLFHSIYNPVWEIFGDFILDKPNVSFELILGNHDILSKHQYEKFGIIIHDNCLHLDPFTLLHDAADIKSEDSYPITGHLHPGVRLRGKAKQSVRMPCFYFTQNFAVLPAFGSFTGLALVRPRKNEQVYGILDTQVIHLSSKSKSFTKSE